MSDNRQRYATVGTAFLGKVAQRLQNIEVEKLSAADVARWTEVAMKLEQAGQLRRNHPGRRDEYLSQITRPEGSEPGVELGEYDQEPDEEGEEGDGER